MNGLQPRNTLIVKVDRFKVPLSDEPDREPPAGREIAESLVDSFRSRGINADDPYECETYYVVDLDIAKQAYRIIVQWDVIGLPPGEEVWTITINERLGCFGSLFSTIASRSIDGDLEQCIAIVKDIEATQTLGSDAQWVTDDELRRLQAGKELRRATR